ncbi:MAG TPA: SulP family inorganic anion transporter [Bacteriovoracaceae bacterium]|nr:SulP family inorganic anion transporter [Bacteriovoracaceae bacterium]
MSFLKYWKNDARSSLVVFLVALPLCLGISLASNAPMSAGLLAGIIGGILVGAIGGSPISVSGPAAGLTVIVAKAITDLGDFEAFTLCVFVSGIFQILFSILRGGVIGNYFPTSVVKGMLAAIGIILILKQLPHALGYDADFMGDESFYQMDGENTFSELRRAIYSTHLGSIIIAVISMLIMIFWEKKWIKEKVVLGMIPGALIAVLTSVALNTLFTKYSPEFRVEERHLVQIPYEGGFRDFFVTIRMPDWSYLWSAKIYITALTIAIVGSLESLLSIDAADKIDEGARVTSKNRELLAQGLGNAVSGLVGGLPITAVIVRTSANANSGAKTQFSSVLHGIWLLLCVVTIPHLLNLIPLSCLAAVLILVGYKLVKPSLLIGMYKKGKGQFIPFVATICAIIFTDLLVGIIIGMVVGFVFVIKSHMHKAIVMVHDGSDYLIRFHKDVSFLQKKALLELLDQIPANSFVVIDGSKSVYVDEDINEIIEDFQRRAPEDNIKVQLQKSSLSLSPLFKEESYG